jgi:heme exporter protein A
VLAILDQPHATTTPTTAGYETPAVHVIDLHKSIDERPILRGVSFEVPPGQSVAILGANGAGKSTLLKILATLTGATSGEGRLFGTSLRHAPANLRAKLGLISHQSLLYRDLTARENLEFFAKLYGVEEPGQRAITLLSLVGLADRADDAVKTFSRGMTQRVAIARALVHRPQLLLADEPFAGLDVSSVAAVEELFEQLHAVGRTVLLVDHDMDRSLRVCQRVILLRDGRVALDELSSDLTATQLQAEMNRP